MPVLEKASEELPDVTFAKLNAQESDNINIALDLGVKQVPAFFIFKDGDLRDKFTGIVLKEDLVNRIREYL
jgi:thiol-disulfide isomerase/thioredoxin